MVEESDVCFDNRAQLDVQVLVPSLFPLQSQGLENLLVVDAPVLAVTVHLTLIGVVDHEIQVSDVCLTHIYLGNFLLLVDLRL